MASKQRALRRRSARQEAKELSVDPEFLSRMQQSEAGERLEAFQRSLQRAEKEIFNKEQQILQLLTLTKELEAQRDGAEADLDAAIVLAQDSIVRLDDEVPEDVELIAKLQEFVERVSEEKEEPDEPSKVVNITKRSKKKK